MQSLNYEIILLFWIYVSCLHVIGTNSFIKVVSKLKCTVGPPATSPAVQVPLQDFFILDEPGALPVECRADEGEKGGEVHLCLILIHSQEMGGISISIQEVGSSAGSFSLNVA